MTRRQIRSLRDKLAIDAFAMAALLGVHVSTIYRWEGRSQGNTQCGTKSDVSSSIDPLQRQVLEAIHAFVATSPDRAVELGKIATNGLVRGGNLFALCEVLKTVLP